MGFLLLFLPSEMLKMGTARDGLVVVWRYKRAPNRPLVVRFCTTGRGNFCSGFHLAEIIMPVFVPGLKKLLQLSELASSVIHQNPSIIDFCVHLWASIFSSIKRRTSFLYSPSSLPMSFLFINAHLGRNFLVNVLLIIT